jgi:hypothetical protein
LVKRNCLCLALCAVVVSGSPACSNEAKKAPNSSASATAANEMLTIKNETGVTLNELLVMPAGEQKWSDANLLAGAAIADGASGTIRKTAFKKAGFYDLSFTGVDESDYYIWGVDIAAKDTIKVTKDEKDKKE